MTDTTSNRPAAILKDVVGGVRRWEIASTFAIDEIQQRYRRSYLGVLWIMVSYVMFVGGISLIFSGFSAQDTNRFILHVAISFAAFSFLVGNLTDGAEVFVSARNWINSVSLPYSIYVYRSICRSLFPFGLQLMVALPLMLALGWRPGPSTILVLPALLIYLINVVGIQYLIGLLGARFRDFTHLLSSITRLLFFVTPILWVRDDVSGVRVLIADLNPLSHYLEIFRAPIMNQMPMAGSWYIVLGITVAIWVTLLLIGPRLRQRLPFWI